MDTLKLVCIVTLLVGLLPACQESQPGQPDPDVPALPDAGTEELDAPEVSSDTVPDTATPPQPLFRAADGAMRTSEGEVLYLRGLNFGGQAKGTPDFLLPFDDADLESLVAAGLNSVRLLTFWIAVAPDAPDSFDDAYLAALAENARRVGEAGLYVVMDMHQDVWGRPFSNHGAPEWACPDELKEGYVPTSPWWANYGSEQVVGCFDNFWSDVALQDAFAAAWAATAEALCDNERVVGFDIMNEPFPGSELVSRTFDNKVLLPFYLRVADAIEQVCPGRLYFIEYSAAGVAGVADPFEVPLEWRDRIVVASHFYPRAVHDPGTEGYDLDFAGLAKDVDDGWERYFEQGIPVWVGEFGGITTNPNFEAYIRDIHTIYYQRFVSTALWDWGKSDGGFALFDAAGALKAEFRAVYRTPVPTLLPEKPLRMEPDWDQGSLTVEVDCVAGRRATFHMPATGCSCASDAPSALADVTADSNGPATSTCASDDGVVLSCSCP